MNVAKKIDSGGELSIDAKTSVYYDVVRAYSSLQACTRAQVSAHIGKFIFFLYVKWFATLTQFCGWLWVTEIFF